MKRHLPKAWMALIGLGIVLSSFPPAGSAAQGKLNVLCTTFPIYQITKNVTQGQNSVSVELMLPSQLGCPHDYALAPQDMQKLSQADILIVNGLGMEEFLNAPMVKANPKVRLLDSSRGIKEILQYGNEEEHGRRGKDAAHKEHNHDGEHGDLGDPGHHAHADANPHLFASPRMAAKLALNIAAGLSRVDPSGSGTYSKNAQAYAGKMNKLADELAALGKRIKNTRIATQHGVFDYLARDMGLEVVAVVQAHAGQEPSAAEMLTIVKDIRKKKAGAIFTEPQYPEKISKTIAQEVGIPAARLDPVATGPGDAPLDYYEKVMRENMKTIEATLGVK